MLRVHLRWILACILIGALATAVVWRMSYHQAVTQTALKGTSDLALAADRFKAQLQRYRELVVLFSDHPDLMALVEGQAKPDDIETANNLLLSAADKTAAVSLTLFDTNARVLASAAKEDVAFDTRSPVFQRALSGALGIGHSPVSQEGRYFYFAAPSFGSDKGVRAVLVVSVDLDRIESEWRGGLMTVYFVDEVGTVFVSNRDEILLWQKQADGGIVPNDGRRMTFQGTSIQGIDVWTVDWGGYVPNQAVHLTQDLLTISMTAEALVDLSPALQIAQLQTAVFTLVWGAFLFMSVFFLERRRSLAEENQRLEARVVERTEALRKAQHDLVQAGKLSALGQMSAGISHELNQPLMAIQQFADNAVKFVEKGRWDVAGSNLGEISKLSHRMARIIKNLRAFARNEAEPVGRVDAVKVISHAIEFQQERLARDDIEVEWAVPRDPIWVRAGEVRLGQVMINLISNAADAMSVCPERRITVAICPVAGAEHTVEIVVDDTGPGIEHPDKIFEPFYTTKEVSPSEGMGLGLSISYGLVQSFGGNIRGTTTSQGARFTIELPVWDEKGE